MKKLLFAALLASCITFSGCLMDETMGVADAGDSDGTSFQVERVPGIELNTADGVLLWKAEYFSAGESDEMGQTVFFSDRGNKQLSSDWVPGDPRLGGFTNMFYAVDDAEGATASGLSSAQTEAAIDRAMATWDGVTCSDMGLTKIGGSNFGQVQDFFTNPAFPGFGILPLPIVLHSGVLPGSFFDQVAPGGGNFILGVAFTLVFIDANGNPTDIDNNGKSDVAIKEIYYNDNFSWNDGSTYDFETVALHEAGHGLSQAHFGKAFRTGANGKLHFSPRAVMNATYSGVQTEINQSDLGGHCSNWAQWPNN